SSGARVSLLRACDALEDSRAARPALGARDPGCLSTLLLAAPGVPAERLRPCLTPLQPGATEPPLEHVTAWSAGVVDAIDRADVVVLCGHGDGHRGLDAGDGRLLPAEALAFDVRRIPAAVVLAMCGSACAGAHAEEPAIALRLARRAVPLAIGFQGREAALDHVAPFVSALADGIAGALERERLELGARVSLRDWEQAIARARRAVPQGAAATVAYVHPLLLADAGPAPAPLRPRGGAARPARRPGAATATPWYVPGQAICFAHDGRVLRIPVPVDTGRRLRLTVRRGREHAAADPDGAGGLTTADLAALADAWELPGSLCLDSVVLAAERKLPDAEAGATWARRSGELGAAIRALAHVAGEPVPPAALALLDAAVAADWGAHDAAPRVVDAADGRRVHRLDRWPGIAVGYLPVRRGRGARPSPPSLAIAADGVAWERVRSAFDDAGALRELIGRQLATVRAAARRDGVVAANVTAAIAAGHDLLALPSAACVSVVDDVAGTVRVAGLAPAASDAPDELRW
ncbi:MAG TPA: hypothetical protein VFU94_08375, partial [Conexibacter sp.]|nr:hypothetical protein [Conexibacter sp.]